MWSRPTDPPPPLDPLRDHEAVRALHSEWARSNRGTPAASPWQRVTGKARRALTLGRSNREFLGSLIRAIDAVARRCDELADRLAVVEGLTEDVAGTFGEDITALRADVHQLQTELGGAGDRG